MKKLTTEEFIERAKAVHGNRYDYSMVNYIKHNIKVKIVCQAHGVFEKSPNHHLNGQGCKACSMEKLSEKFRDDDNFVSKAIEIHGDKYDYSKVIYKNNKTKVVIICKKHGEFLQVPDSHLHGRGCPMCIGKYDKKYYKNGLAIYETYHQRLESVGIECKRDNNDKNVLSVRCYKCGRWYVPGIISVERRIATATGRINGESNLYCSDNCKTTCPVYYFDPKHIDPRSVIAVKKTEQKLARSCQTNTLKQIQCNTVGYNYCEKCGDIIDVELHHTFKISEHGSDAINSAGHILLCAGCHTELHGECK